MRRLVVIVGLVVGAGCGSATIKDHSGTGGQGGATAGTGGGASSGSSGGGTGGSGGGGTGGSGGGAAGSAGVGPGGSIGGAQAGGAAGCNLSAPFSTPMLVPGINTTAHDDSVALSPDETVAWISSTRPGGAGAFDIWTASRTGTGTFGAATLVDGVNSSSNEQQPRITGDGLTLFFTSNRLSARGYEIMIATRPSALANFTTPVALANVNTDADDSDQYLTFDGQTLYFSSNRSGGPGSHDIRVATLAANGSFAAPELVGGVVNTSDSDASPVPSRDGLTLYFATNHGTTSYDIYRAQRSSATSPFNQVELLDTLNSELSDRPVELSADQCTLYISSNRIGGPGDLNDYDIYVARRGN